MTLFRKAVSVCFKALILVSVLAISAAIGVTAVVAWQVFYGDYSALQKSTILAKIKEETTLYYLDEQTRIGSIFESQHRRYVPIEEIPVHLLNATVAAEDKSFYHHFGIDLISILKAATEGLLNGGQFRRGGSTITQQTVKNIIDDWEASFARKFREMIKALQLERMYSKKQILEFYLNQFHVAGNGTGIGIAAKYYFNKEVGQLNLVEAAFIAGSVKGPSKYNPFIKYTKKARAKAEAYANERKNYVLRRMLEQELISKEEYEEAVATAVPFNRGEFRTAEVALVELIKSQLNKKELLEALGIKTVDDLNIAGLHVYTTIDAKFQEAAQLAMRKNLSRLETILNGFSTEPENKFIPLRYLKENEFVFGKVEEISGSKLEDFSIKLSFGIPTGIIPNESLIRYAKLLDLPEGTGYQAQLTKLIKTIKPGDILFTQVISYDKDTHEAVVELQKRPKISGGLIALDKGEVRAVISGFDTLGFNRAMYAKRQPGSVFKSLVFFASLQLGWNILDQIDNGRQIFPYQGKFYFPRPDHETPYDQTSMLWTGVMSENLSSVSLGSKLTDKLNFEEFKKLLAVLDLAPHAGELPRDFHYRISRATGVTPDNNGFMAYQLQRAIDELSADLIFSGHNDLLKKLKRMWWGNGYISEAKSQIANYNNNITKSELKTRIELLENNFERMRKLASSLSEDWNIITMAVNNNNQTDIINLPHIQEKLQRFRVLSSSNSKPELGYFRRLPEEDYLSDNFSDLKENNGRPLNDLDIQAIWGEGGILGEQGKAGIGLSEVKINGFLTYDLFQKLSSTFATNYERFTQSLAESTDSYQLQRYYQHHDFRIGLGLYYLVQLSKQCGVFNYLEPVLSFPLGSNDVTASEVAKIYQTFINGQTYRFYKDGPENQINFIRRIEDRFGNILYEPKPIAHQLVKPEIAYQMHEILGKTVTHGTARRARGELFITFDQLSATNKEPSHIRIPAFGKTGSTNDFRTSYFAGFFPFPNEEHSAPLDPMNSYIVSAYVGYDWNKSMRKGRQRIYGGSGALPLWIDFAKEIIKIKEYQNHFDPLDINMIARNEWPLNLPKQTTPLLVDLPRGLILRAGGNEDIETWKTTNISQTGETYQDLFALGASVRSIVHIPQKSHQGFSEPFRLFAPFEPSKQDMISPEPLSDELQDGDDILDEDLETDISQGEKDENINHRSTTQSTDSGNQDEEIW